MIEAYIASQAAVSAASYFSADFAAATTWWLIGALKTPDMYGRDYSMPGINGPYFRGNRLKVGKIFNYYNDKDYALSGLAGWDGNNAMKPDYRFDYQGDMLEYNEGVDRFIQDSGTVADLGVRNESERFQIFSYIAESRSRALGTQKIDEGNITSLNLKENPYGYDKNHYSHSRQFRSNVANEWMYWSTLMDNIGFKTTLDKRRNINE